MTFDEWVKSELPHEQSNVVWAMKKAWEAGVAEEREACAQVCDRIAEMMEAGAGEPEPGQRLRQAAQMMRSNALSSNVTDDRKFSRLGLAVQQLIWMCPVESAAMPLLGGVFDALDKEGRAYTTTIMLDEPAGEVTA